MKIKSIELKNFKPFKGDDNKFDFDSDDHQPVILVKANNGSGKTSLLQALKWAFYGIGGIAYYKTNAQEMVNNVAKTEGDGETSVKVVFQHNDHSYTLKRSYKFSKTDKWNEDPQVHANRFTIDVDGQPEVDSVTICMYWWVFIPLVCFRKFVTSFEGITMIIVLKNYLYRCLTIPFSFCYIVNHLLRVCFVICYSTNAIKRPFQGLQ
jgi:hypothetical protein